MGTSENLVLDFARKHDLEINSFISCAQNTITTVDKLVSIYDIPPFSSDVDLVVFGSLARNECTKGSDVDWTLLIDGQANANHLSMSLDLRKRIGEAGLKQPGSSGMFGQETISHGLIHQIGGSHDTNHNLTRRILLLLESEKINFESNYEPGGTAYDRVLTGIIKQYIVHDSGLNSNRSSIPRFLLNDIVRFWRTMCVDFAYKQKEQDGEKWALRNIKLRMSRKSLYVKGLLMCFACQEIKPNKDILCEKLKTMCRKTPFELIIDLSEQLSISDVMIVNLLKYYNSFLEMLNTDDKREKLEKMNMLEVYENIDFIELRNVCDRFQETLDEIFIKTTGKLQQLTFKYGIF